MTTHGRRLGIALVGAAACLLAYAPVAAAHPGHVPPGDAAWAAGAAHPLLGADHLLAVLASGLLAVRVGSRRALWVVPVSFVALMLFGGLLAYAAVPLPHGERAVALSVIVLGLAVAMLPSVPLQLAAGAVGLFAVFHGHAHVAEFGGAALVPYMAGFAVSTLALHAAAIAAALGAADAARAPLVRLAGAAIAAGFASVLLFST